MILTTDFEVISKTEHKEGMAIQLQNQAGGIVLGQLTLNISVKEAESLKVTPGSMMAVSVGK